MGIDTLRFTETLAQVEPRLRAIADWTTPMGRDKWSRIELLGHLLDSAANNHQRFVRALAQISLEWPGYDQESHVKVQRYQHADPQLLVDLVLNFNRQLAWLFKQFPEDKLDTICRIGNDTETTLETLVLDYVAHAEHHLKQLVGVEGIEWSGRRWPPAVL